jgi:ubiquinone/menaquinone biosynthesis C-methylase UbiE
MMPPLPGAHARGFDRLTRVYHALELVAFGRSLAAARVRFLDRLAGCRRILVFGEGDGRCLARLVRLAPAARITCVDASAPMLARASGRLDAGGRARVEFVHADARDVALPAAAFDAVVTLFFLDCFTDADVRRLIDRTARSLAPGAVWLFADFALPARGWRRLRARLWVGFLYAFFRWETGIEARRLPDMAGALAAAGFAPEAEQTRQFGLLRSAVYKQRATDT